MDPTRDYDTPEETAEERERRREEEAEGDDAERMRWIDPTM